MTKKDYIIIAEAIKDSQLLPGQDSTLQFHCFVRELSRVLKNDNPKFNQYIFERACGITNN